MSEAKMYLELSKFQSEDKTIHFIEIRKNGSLVNAQNPVTPEELEGLEFPEVSAGEAKGLVVSGMPMWANASTVCWYKNMYPWIATFDPRSGGGVVVHSMAPAVKLGTVIKVPKA